MYPFCLFPGFNKPDEKYSFIFDRYELVSFDFLSGFYVRIVAIDYKLRIPVMKIFQLSAVKTFALCDNLITVVKKLRPQTFSLIYTVMSLYVVDWSTALKENRTTV